MAKFLLEVPHERGTLECARAVEAFLRAGSHFLTHADWGCKDGDHRAWVVVDVDSKEDARGVVPPPYRAQARIIKLNSFTLQDIEGILREHSR